MTETEQPDAPPPRTFRAWMADMPRSKKIALIAAAGLLVTSAVMWLAEPGGSTTTPAGTLPSNLVADGPGGTASQVPAEEPAARGVFRLGFSFIAGFALGSFLRATLRLASIALGFWLAMTLTLSYYGLVDVNWQGIDELWSTFTGNIQSEWGSFQRFITGSLPAAALVTGGFALGVRRH